MEQNLLIVVDRNKILVHFVISSCVEKVRAGLMLGAIRYEYYEHCIKTYPEQNSTYEVYAPQQRLPCLFIAGEHAQGNLFTLFVQKD